MNEFIKRLKLPTPIFFKKIRNAFIAITVSAASIIAAQESGQIQLPEWVIEWAKHFATAGILVSIVAQSSAKPEIQNKELN